MIGPTDIQIILGKVRPLSRPHPEAHPQVLIIAPDVGGDCTTTALLASECHSGRLRLSAAATTAGWLALSGSHSTKVGLSQLAITLQVGRWKDHHCTACHLRSPSNRSDHIRCAHSEVTARLRVTTRAGRSPSS